MVEIAQCRDHLKSEFALVRPRIVACLGRIAWQELAGRTVPFLPRQGLPAESNGMLLFPMYHPAFVNRGAYPVRSYMKDFNRLSRLCRAEPKDDANRVLPRQLHPAGRAILWKKRR
jgi:DNA polymerase